MIGIIGPGCTDSLVRHLKRELKFITDIGFEYHPNLKHAKKVRDILELKDNTKPAPTPGTKQTAKNLTDGEDELDKPESAKFMKGAGTLLYHSLDDPRVQFESGMVMRGMSKPTVLDKARLHRVGKYLKASLV